MVQNSMPKRVLFIAPVCPFGHHGGHATRTRQILKLLQEEFEVWFLYAPFRLGPANPLDRRMLGDRLLEYPSFVIRLHSTIARLKARFGIYRERPISTSPLKCIDSLSPPGLTRMSRKIVLSYQIDVVLVGYVFLTPAFRKLPSSVRTIVDAHDEFGQRHHRLAASGNMAWPWFKANLSDDQEAQGLNRADVTLAIQFEEAGRFRSKGVQHCVVVPFVPEQAGRKKILQPVKAPAEKSLVYFGSDWSPNVSGMLWFLAKVWPILREKDPDISLKVAGTVCKGILNAPDGVDLLGQVGDIYNVVTSSHVFICPVFHGTGFNVKMMEAMAWGMPFVATPMAFRGLPLSKNHNFPLTEHPEDFSYEILRLLESESIRTDLKERAMQYVQDLAAFTREELVAAVAGNPVTTPSRKALEACG